MIDDPFFRDLRTLVSAEHKDLDAEGDKMTSTDILKKWSHAPDAEFERVTREIEEEALRTKGSKVHAFGENLKMAEARSRANYGRQMSYIEQNFKDYDQGELYSVMLNDEKWHAEEQAAARWSESKRTVSLVVVPAPAV